MPRRAIADGSKRVRSSAPNTIRPLSGLIKPEVNPIVVDFRPRLADQSMDGSNGKAQRQVGDRDDAAEALCHIDDFELKIGSAFEAGRYRAHGESLCRRCRIQRGKMAERGADPPMRPNNPGGPNQDQNEQESIKDEVLILLKAHDRLRDEDQKPSADDRSDARPETADEKHEEDDEHDVDVIEVWPDEA